MNEPTVDQVITAYLAQRRKKEELERAHKEALKPINTRMEKAETWLLSRMLQDGLQHLAGSGGTAYIKERTSCSVSDWEAFFNHMKETENWHMLTHGASKTAVAEYLAEHGELPPGVKYSAENCAQVRAKAK